MDKPEPQFDVLLSVYRPAFPGPDPWMAVDTFRTGELEPPRIGVPLTNITERLMSQQVGHLTRRVGEPSTAPSASEAPSSSKRRLLVVDDNADLAMMTAMLLRTKQYEVHTRLSGPEALADVECLQPDVILLDLGMPAMDGYETARRLRALPWGQHGLIVALTGYGQLEDIQRTKQAGFDGHLIKPVDLKVLTELLSRLLDTP